MKCVKFLAIAALVLTGASAVAMDNSGSDNGSSSAPSSPLGSPRGGNNAPAAKSWLSNPLTRHVHRLYNGQPIDKLVLGIEGLALVYGATKLSSIAKRAWDKVYLGKFTDAVEDTVREAKDNPKSKEGAITAVGAFSISAFLVWYNGLHEKISLKTAKEWWNKKENNRKA